MGSKETELTGRIRNHPTLPERLSRTKVLPRYLVKPLIVCRIGHERSVSTRQEPSFPREAPALTTRYQWPLADELVELVELKYLMRPFFSVTFCNYPAGSLGRRASDMKWRWDMKCLSADMQARILQAPQLGLHFTCRLRLCLRPIFVRYL